MHTAEQMCTNCFHSRHQVKCLDLLDNLNIHVLRKCDAKIDRFCICSLSLYRLLRTVDRESSIGGLYVCAGGCLSENLIKTQLIYSVSYFNLG